MINNQPVTLVKVETNLTVKGATMKKIVLHLDWRLSNQSLPCLLAITPSGAKLRVEIRQCLLEQRQLATFPLLCFLLAIR
jgi:hypothetical protein